MSRSPTVLRVLTLNLFGQEEPLAERMGSVVHWLSALDLDVIALQEVRQTTTLPNQAETIARALGMHHAYAPATRWGQAATDEEGLALLARWPLTAVSATELPHATEKERRIVLGAFAESPVGRVPVFTTHLNWRMTHGREREDQVVAVEAVVAATPKDNLLPRIVMGDFNASPSCDEIRFWRGEHTLGGKRVYYQDAFALAHPGEPGITWARRNHYTDRLAFLERDRRLDYIFVSQRDRSGAGEIVDAQVVLDELDGDVFPSDHFGVYAEIRLIGKTTST